MKYNNLLKIYALYGVKLPKIPCPNPNFVNLDIDIICVMHITTTAILALMQYTFVISEKNILCT